MRIITGILSIIGIVALAVLAVFGGLYLWNQYAPSFAGTGDSAITNQRTTSTPADAPESLQQEQTPDDPAQSSPPAVPGAPSSALVVEPSCARLEIEGQVLYYRPERNYPPFFCVHPAGQDPRLSAGEVVANRIPDPYAPNTCAIQAQKIFCSADQLITTADLDRWRVVQTLTSRGLSF